MNRKNKIINDIINVLLLFNRLSDLQLLYSVLAAKTLERGAHLRNTQERSEQKRLIISNIKLAILNMVTYCLTRGVTLPGDREGARLRDTGR